MMMVVMIAFVIVVLRHSRTSNGCIETERRCGLVHDLTSTGITKAPTNPTYPNKHETILPYLARMTSTSPMEPKNRETFSNSEPTGRKTSTTQICRILNYLCQQRPNLNLSVDASTTRGEIPRNYIYEANVCYDRPLADFSTATPASTFSNSPETLLVRISIPLILSLLLFQP